MKEYMSSLSHFAYCKFFMWHGNFFLIFDEKGHENPKPPKLIHMQHQIEARGYVN